MLVDVLVRAVEAVMLPFIEAEPFMPLPEMLMVDVIVTMAVPVWLAVELLDVSLVVLLMLSQSAGFSLSS